MLLYWCPHSRAYLALWMMEEAGVAYERRLVDIRQEDQSRPDYRRINPMMKVPALDDGGTIVTECAAICAHVADRVPAAGLAPPVGDPLRGRYLSWLFFASGCIDPAFAQRGFRFELPSMTAGWGSYERVMDVLDEALQAGPWILGERFSAADVMIAGYLFYGMDLWKIVEPRPSFRAYVDRTYARPAYRSADAIDEAVAAELYPAA